MKKRLTQKDWRIINRALVLYEGEIESSEKGDFWFDVHAKEFGNPTETITTVREKVRGKMTYGEG